MVGKRFTKGQSGNPGGRPKGLEKRVRELLKDDIDTMTLAMRDIVFGTAPKEGPLAGQQIRTRDRIEAYKTLTNRGWGRPPQTVELRPPSQPDDNLPELTNEQLRSLADLDAGLSAEAPADDGGDDDEPDS